MIATTFDFDAWRANYDSMTYQDHLDTYSELYRLYPVQQHFDGEACGEFLNQLNIGSANVDEVGGWDGELASRMLRDRPGIYLWHNVEICAEAATATVCDDRRYQVIQLPDFVWNLPGRTLGYDILVMSHSAEHMRWKELRSIFERAIPPVRAIYLASPLPIDGSDPDWNGYPGTHILEVGWNEIKAFLGKLGFRQMPMPRTHEVRCWQKP